MLFELSLSLQLLRMFRTGSPYSPFFTSGLLSPITPRRGSLPTDSLSPTSDSSSAFYFTLQPKRDTSEYRSFLSLDLAESQSLPSEVPFTFAPSTLTPSTLAPSTLAPSTLAPPPATLRLRRSRDSIRSIPSPKPAPDTTLPDIPISSTPPRLPSIVISPSLGISLERASHSAPTLTLSVPSSNRNSTSTVSTSIRKVNRSHALARLEGRTNSTRRPVAPSKPVKRNFMSMSDEDSDADDNDDDYRRVTLSVLNEPEDLVLPPASPIRYAGARTAPVGGRFPSPSPRKRTKEWFPLKSFIDLQSVDDDTSRWTWRSFVQVASVS